MIDTHAHLLSLENKEDIIDKMIEDGLDFILSCLSEDEIRLIQYKYIDRKTVTWISRQFKTSVHEIERRLQRIRSKLTNPKRFVYILHDITEDNSKIKLSFDEESFNKIYKDDFIDLLDLPERTSNAIYRNNMYRISDILDEMERNHRRIVWYDRLRNVGRCSAKEIVNKLCELNFL